MKLFKIVFGLAFIALLFTQCRKILIGDSDINNKVLAFTVTVENVSAPYMYFESGVASIPEGATEAGPALPGHSFEFSFHAGPNHKLSFATMYGWSNDGFYAPAGEGINLYNSGVPVTGDITSEVMLWDAGTQMNQMPGVDNTHDGADTDENVQLMSVADDMYDYGMVDTNLKITLEYNSDHMFTVTVENLDGSTTPISPVVWVIHTMANPLFEVDMKDYGMGLEEVAETGNASILSEYLSMNSGYVSPVAPVLWVVHEKDEMPVFINNTPDMEMGLELLAETGNPGDLFTALMSEDFNVGAYVIPDGASDPGPLFPGDKYTFSFNAKPNQYLSIASMLGNSNDVFFAFGDNGIKLAFGNAVKDITDEIMLWDAGTEVNEYPGTKSADDTEGGTVRLLDDGYTYPAVNQIIKVTIHKN